jgi:hypothetical protein
MWSDEARQASTRVHRRRVVVGLTLGALVGAGVALLLVGVLPLPAVAVMAAAIGAGAWLLAASPERTLGHRRPLAANTSGLAPIVSLEPAGYGPEEVRETRLGYFSRLRVTEHTLIVEALLATTAARIDNLAWVYGVRNLSRRWIPFLPDTSLVIKFVSGTEIALPCFYRQITPCLSAIRYFAGHVALGWDPELASSWAANQAMFVASVRSRLGRVSGAGGDA